MRAIWQAHAIFADILKVVLYLGSRLVSLPKCALFFHMLSKIRENVKNVSEMTTKVTESHCCGNVKKNHNSVNFWNE